GRGARAAAEEADAPQQLAVGDAGGAEENLVTWGEVLGLVDSGEVVEAESLEPLLLRLLLLLVGVVGLEAGLDLAAEAAHGRSGDDSLGSAADADDRVDAGAAYGGGDAGREVAVRDQTDAGAGGADVRDELLVPRAVEHHDGQIAHPTLEGRGDVPQVLGDRRVDVDPAAGGGPDDDLLHVDVGGVEQAAALGGGEHRDGVRSAGGAEVGPLQRIDGDIHSDGAVLAAQGADLLADIEHRRLVPFAFADHHPA